MNLWTTGNLRISQDISGYLRISDMRFDMEKLLSLGDGGLKESML